MAHFINYDQHLIVIYCELNNLQDMKMGTIIVVCTDYCTAQDVIPHGLIPCEVKEPVFQREILLQMMTAVH